VKYCCFRFDADTHACVGTGIPRLVELGDRLRGRFTFFVNMGRAFDRRLTLLKIFRRLRSGGRRGTISAAAKLGWGAAWHAAVFNPPAGRSQPGVLRAAVSSGHEIGLHGGRNHAQWERFAQGWDEDRLRREVQSGLRWLEDCGVPAPSAFASPAWNSPAALRRVLPQHGFRILADLYDAACEDIRAEGRLWAVPTNITAAPGNAGYFETMRLRGWTSRQITADFRAQLAGRQRFAAVYDHPFYAGVHALTQVGELVRVAQDEGFAVETISAATRCLTAESPGAPLGR
jgi:peptidoglycan/xylan/chitin deacetylase (PgdA/CDA1 family)